MNRRIPQSNTPPSHSKPPDIPSGGLLSSGTQPAAEATRGQGPPQMRSIQKATKPIWFGGFLHPLFLLPDIQCTLACFCRRLRQSAIMAMNSEFVGLPLMFETV